MNWYEAWDNVRTALEADSDIADVLGEPPDSALFLEGDRAIRIPCMTAMLVVDTEDEIYAPAEWQFDLYTYTMPELVQVEKAMRRILNQPLAVTLEDATLTCEFVAGQLLRGPERDPYYRRILEFRLTPVRSRYYRPQLAGGS